MTIQEKKKALSDFCVGRSCCNCPLEHTECDLGSYLASEEKVQYLYSLAFQEETKPTQETTTETPQEHDPVNHPSHYTSGGMECIDEMILIFGLDATMKFCLLNAWKYRRRALDKNGQQDMDKSHWYLAKYKELKEKLNGLGVKYGED